MSKPSFDLLGELTKEKYPPAFVEWVSYNDHIRHGFNSVALLLHGAGKKYNAFYIADVLRRDTNLYSTRDKFKINSNHLPYLSRLAMAEHQELAGYFDIKALKHMCGIADADENQLTLF
ncbi:MAG: hypothetical protein ACR2PR_06310 [Pseudohongiellaceae bacterium]